MDEKERIKEFLDKQYSSVRDIVDELDFFYKAFHAMRETAIEQASFRGEIIDTSTGEKVTAELEVDNKFESKIKSDVKADVIPVEVIPVDPGTIES